MQISNYTMKARLYPNKTQKILIDKAIYAVQCFYNCTLYEIWNNYKFTIEKEKLKKNENEETEMVHFVNFFDIRKADWKKELTELHPCIADAPAAAITSSVYGVVCDMQKSIGTKPIEFQRPMFYNKKHPRNSYSYQETFSKIKTNVDIHDKKEYNNNVAYIDLNRIGLVKMRGWNRKIKFDENFEIDFIDYAKQNTKKGVGITISKDKCGDYWICFKLQNVHKQIPEPTIKQIGVDLGMHDLMITSEGDKFEPKNYKRDEKKRTKALNRRLSRRWGWSNIKFRNAYCKDTTITPSKNYEETKLKLAKHERKTQRKRSYYNNNLSLHLVEKSELIGMETLNVKGMMKNHHLAYTLSDLAWGDLIRMITYKSEWYGRQFVQIDKWFPSSQLCNNCGYRYEGTKNLNVRNWVCPKCGAEHDRDINAAKNIRDEAVRIFEN